MSTAMQNVSTWAAVSASDLTDNLFCFAKATTGNEIDVAGSGEVTIGVIVEGAAAGAPSTVQLDGVGKVILATTLAPGVRVISDTSGHATTWSSGVWAGILLTGGNANDVVSIKLV